MIVPECNKCSKTVDVYGNRFPLNSSRGCMDETCYSFMFDAANKAHPMPAKQRRTHSSEHEIKYECQSKADDEERECFTRVIWNNAVIDLQIDQRQAKCEQIDHQGSEIDFARNRWLGDRDAGIRTGHTYRLKRPPGEGFKRIERTKPLMFDR